MDDQLFIVIKDLKIKDLKIGIGIEKKQQTKAEDDGSVSRQLSPILNLMAYLCE